MTDLLTIINQNIKTTDTPKGHYTPASWRYSTKYKVIYQVITFTFDGFKYYQSTVIL